MEIVNENFVQLGLCLLFTNVTLPYMSHIIGVIKLFIEK